MLFKILLILIKFQGYVNIFHRSGDTLLAYLMAIVLVLPLNFSFEQTRDRITRFSTRTLNII